MRFYCKSVFYLEYRLGFEKQRDLLQRDLDRLGHWAMINLTILNARFCSRVLVDTVQDSATFSGSLGSTAHPGLCPAL